METRIYVASAIVWMMLQVTTSLQQNRLIVIRMDFSLTINITIIVALSQMIMIAVNYLLKISLSPTLVISFDEV